MMALQSSRMSETIYPMTQHYILEDSNFQHQCYKTLKTLHYTSKITWQYPALSYWLDNTVLCHSFISYVLDHLPPIFCYWYYIIQEHLYRPVVNMSIVRIKSNNYLLSVKSFNTIMEVEIWEGGGVKKIEHSWGCTNSVQERIMGWLDRQQPMTCVCACTCKCACRK
jgi:hypothetical protein